MKEVNFDGLIGPTHHHGGYAYGNLASMHAKSPVSNPKRAALQGLTKMKRLIDLGVPQAILPPQERPSFFHLRACGFQGSDEEILAKAYAEAPELLFHLSSAASMWTANAATITPSCDTQDKRLHITPANLASTFHRSIEGRANYHLFKTLFSDEELFAIHHPLPSSATFGDEGAANHTRFAVEGGLHLFVWGRSAFDHARRIFPARQALEASKSVARLNQLADSQLLFVQLNPQLIDLGIFHADVISVGHEKLFLCHERAFVDTPGLLSELEERGVTTLSVSEEQLPVEEAVKSYFFNSQIVTLPSGEQLLVAPEECRDLPLDWLPMPIEFVDLKESMENGGGPACLRLRILLNKKELDRIHSHILLNNESYHILVKWVEEHYRDRLKIEELGDPLFLKETREALDRLTQILSLPPIYDFQID